MTTKSNAHEICLHPATPAMRNKCRRVRKAVAELVASTDAELKDKIGQRVIGWRTEDSESEGPKLIQHEGILDRSYQHRDGFTVWIVVSDARPKGTGHMAAFVHVV